MKDKWNKKANTFPVVINKAKNAPVKFPHSGLAEQQLEVDD